MDSLIFGAAASILRGFIVNAAAKITIKEGTSCLNSRPLNVRCCEGNRPIHPCPERKSLCVKIRELQAETETRIPSRGRGGLSGLSFRTTGVGGPVIRRRQWGRLGDR